MKLRTLLTICLLGWSGCESFADPLAAALLNPNLAPIADGTPNGWNYIQRGDWVCEFTAHGQRYRVIIPDGFTSDGTSIPRVLWSLAGIERDGLERRASWLHDYLYKNRGSVTRLTVMIAGEWRGVAIAFTRDEVDGIFASLLLDSGVTRTRTAIMWTAVRAEGQKAWDSHILTK